MASLSTIESSTWGISTIGYGVIAEGIALIRQRIHIVLRTSKSSDPLRPHFGSEVYQYIDVPLTIAIPNIKKAMVEALQLWMPEIKVVAIRHTLVGPANPVFEITYQVSDESLTDKLVYDIRAGQTSGSTASEIILQAFFPPNPNNYRYQVKLIKNNNPVNPAPELSGFATIRELFDWVKANWFFYGRWFLLNDRLLCYMSNEGVNNASLSISVQSVVRVEAAFPPLEPGQSYQVDFLVNGQPALPAMTEHFSNPGEVLFWVQINWQHFGSWQIEGMPANNNSVFTDEFSLEFDAPLPDTFKLVLTASVENFIGELTIITV